MSINKHNAMMIPKLIVFVVITYGIWKSIMTFTL